ncbi:MAG: hypothetical protein HOI47_07300 [Candidatus Scalindua sp.]|jgi:hypothetical protein|nr:hypothetical protein [Candidatus Scalindua sp.]MBT6226446.1 hypothetical protein [Candidatus Scalindua sp.]
MVLCYWKLCSCPDSQPCSEHHGNHCGLFNGLQITNNNQVADSITSNADAAIQRMTADEAAIDAEIARSEARKKQLEEMKRELEAAFDGAQTISQRRAAIQKGKQAYSTAADVNQEIIAVTQKISALTTGWQSAFSVMSTRLIQPYSDPTGFCDCYNSKIKQLASINGQINTAMTAYNADRAELAIYQTNIVNIVKTPGTIVAGLGIWAYIIFGVGAALLKALFVILLFVAILVYALLIRILFIVKRMARLSRQIQGFQLIYYRVQNIGTCQKFIGDPLWFGEGWWLGEVLKNLPDYKPENSEGDVETE